MNNTIDIAQYTVSPMIPFMPSHFWYLRFYAFKPKHSRVNTTALRQKHEKDKGIPTNNLYTKLNYEKKEIFV